MKMRPTQISFVIILCSFTISSFRVVRDLNNTLQTSSGSAKMEKNATVIVDSNQHNFAPNEIELIQNSVEEKVISQSQIPEDLFVRLPMEDQYHSQLSETHLPNACGPTALFMVLDYLDLEESLANVIGKHQFSSEQGGYDPNCVANPVCTSPGALAHVAHEEYGLTVEAHDGWTFEEIQRTLAAGQPIIADVVWRLADEGLGHFVVIYGIDVEQQIVYYHDPYDGAEMAASWEKFSAAWDGPVDLGDPLQPEGHFFWGMTVSIEL